MQGIEDLATGILRTGKLSVQGEAGGIMDTALMKALKCKTLGTSVMYIVIYTYIIHGMAIICIRGQMRECTGKYTEIWQRQK